MNHAIVSVVNGEPAKVRCRTCHNDHDYRHEQAPPPKVDLRKQALFNEALKKINPAAAAEAEAVADVEIETDNLAPDLVLDEAVPGLDSELDGESAPAEEPAPAPPKAPAKAKPRGRKSAK
jgi:hypothetical protein